MLSIYTIELNFTTNCNTPENEWRFGLEAVLFNPNGNRFFLLLCFSLNISFTFRTGSTWSFQFIHWWIQRFFFALLSKFKQMADVRNTCDKHTFAFTLEIIYGGLHNLVWSFVFSFIWTIFDRICSHMCGCRLCLPWQQINAHNGWVAWEKKCVIPCKQHIFNNDSPSN